jgi:hypothetical protein
MRSAVSVALPVPVILHTPGLLIVTEPTVIPGGGRGEGGVASGDGGVVGVAAGIVAVAIRPIGGDRPIGGGVVPRAGKVRRVGGGCESAEGRNGNREWRRKAAGRARKRLVAAIGKSRKAHPKG